MQTAAIVSLCLIRLSLVKQKICIFSSINKNKAEQTKQQETQTSETAKDGRRTEKARASSDR